MAVETGSRRVRFVVSYDGAAFRGFAPNPGVRTVLDEFQAAVARVVRKRLQLTGAGRTDAGVHAWGQVISGDLPDGVDLDRLMQRLNKLCAPSIAVRSIEWAGDDFDARFSATSRRYRYHIWNDLAPNPLLAAMTWHQPRPLDIDLMRAGADALTGEHDFSSFCRRPKVGDDQPEPSMVRILHVISWERVDTSPLLRFEVEGSAFCHQMVRSIVGTTVDMGNGKIAPAEMPSILDARDRSRAGTVAPPSGLVLWAVGYDGRRWDDV